MNKNNAIISEAMVYVNKLLLPLEGLYYHQYNHSLEVMERCVYLGKEEKLNSEEIEILALAGLFHDTGFVIQYDDNEYIGAKIARNYLTSVLYSNEKIKIIERLILATQASYREPKDILEKIIKDADLDNLGRDDFFEKKNKMKKELETIKKIKMKDPEWDHASLVLLNEHKYFTDSQKKEREGKKIENRRILESMLKELQD
ncbi:MAG: HD domain-containing protein [Candidatus Gracilibacteria bacterium]|nr:HD domain-containing protein [Candidatus Gracilibacteria bacterium]